jgi:hypothetical protein
MWGLILIAQGCEFPKVCPKCSKTDKLSIFTITSLFTISSISLNATQFGVYKMSFTGTPHLIASSTSFADTASIHAPRP